jgi:antitoxin ParD1/3/4
MNISLTNELENLVYEKVKSGMYHSASEVIRDALRLLTERDQMQQLKLKEIQHQIQKGIDSLERGEGIPAEEVLSKLRTRSEQRLKKAKASNK